MKQNEKKILKRHDAGELMFICQQKHPIKTNIKNELMAVKKL